MSEVLDLVPAEVQAKVQTEISEIVSGVSTVQVIENDVHYQNAVALTKTVKVLAKSIEDLRDALVRPRNTEVKEINAWFKNPADRLASVEKSLKAAIQAYQAMIEQKRLEAQRRADEEARKEREKIEAAARVLREKEEAARRAEEEARRKAEAAKQAEDDACRRAEAAQSEEARKIALAEAEKARKASEAAAREESKAAEKAEAAASSASLKETVAESVVAVQVQAPISKAEGVATVTTYSAKIVDKVAAIKACIEAGKFHLVELNEAMIGKMVVAEKEFFKMPGVEVVKTISTRVRS